MPTTRTLTNAGAPLHSPEGDLLGGVQIHFQLMDMGGRPSDAWDAISNERVGGETVIVTTDAAGEFSVDLWPNTRGNRETKYKCRVQFEGFREFSGVIEDVPGELQWAAFMLAGSSMEPQDMSAIAEAITSHINAADPHTQYAKESDLGNAAGLDVGTTAGTVAAGDDPRLSDSRPPTGGAGGVLSGSYPNPDFAVDMATQGELDAVNAAKVDKVAGKGLSTEDYTTAEKNKLAAIASGATANATDAQLRDRATHTGAQAISTVTGLQDALDAKEAAGTAATAVSSHVAAGDPHPQYTTAAEAAAAAPVQSVAGKTGAVNLAKADVGLSNVDNTSDANKPVSTAQQTALNLKAPLASPTFTGTVSGITKSMVGLGNVDNTADSAKPVSTAQAAAIATATAIHPFLLIGA